LISYLKILSYYLIMNERDTLLFTVLINSKIKHSRQVIDDFKGDNPTDYMFYISNNIDDIYHQFDIYNCCDYRSKNQSYSNNIEFILKYYPKVTRPVKKTKSTTYRSIYCKMIKDLINIYIYNPSAGRIQKVMFKRAADIVHNRDNKRLRSFI
jgi:hypothetical protein